MKKITLSILICISLIAAVIIAKKQGYKIGYKRALTDTEFLKKKESWEKGFENKFPLDPNKQTIRILSMNFGDDTPPQLSEVLPLHQIIREKYNIEYVDKDPHIILHGHLNKHKVPNYPDAIKIFYTGEVFLENDPPKYLDNFDLVLGFDFIDKPNYFRLPFQYVYQPIAEKIRHDYDRKMSCNPKKKHFACFLVSNGGEWRPGKFDGASTRTHLFHRLSLYKKVLSGGKYLNNIGSPAPNTFEFLSQCKFTIAYENTLNYPGYVTEKPFNAWLAGTVPIYNTEPSGLVDLNKNAVIFAGDFKDEEALVDYIIKVDNDDKLYCDIWNKHITNDSSRDYESVKNELRKKVEELFARKLKISSSEN
ncbi:MAG: hypothetical protein RLZZ59_832 [Pseudomonadota bacterium]|jgi:hypothetical protein